MLASFPFTSERKKATTLAVATGSKNATTLVVASGRILLLILSLASEHAPNGGILPRCWRRVLIGETHGETPDDSGHTIGQLVNAEKS